MALFNSLPVFGYFYTERQGQRTQLNNGGDINNNESTSAHCVLAILASVKGEIGGRHQVCSFEVALFKFLPFCVWRLFAWLFARLAARLARSSSDFRALTGTSQCECGGTRPHCMRVYCANLRPCDQNTFSASLSSHSLFSLLIQLSALTTFAANLPNNTQQILTTFMAKQRE